MTPADCLQSQSVTEDIDGDTVTSSILLYLDYRLCCMLHNNN